MSDQPAETHVASRSAVTTVRAVRWLAVAVAVFFVAAAVLQVAAMVQGEGITLGGIAIALLSLACAGAAAGLLFGLAALLRGLRGIHAALIRVEQAQIDAKDGPAAAELPSFGDATLPIKEPMSEPAPGGSPAPWQELIMLLQDIRDNSLLSLEERKEKKLRSVETEFHQTRELVMRLIAQGEFSQARLALDSLQLRHPGDARTDPLAEQIESAREKQEVQDVRAVVKQVDDLITISAWQRALGLVQQLQQQHPDSKEAVQLMMRVEREYTAFQEEQRRRMHLEVQRFVTRRRWEEALAAAQTFIERFPGCAESEGFLLEIPTLKNNAEIERRQDLETQIMEYAKHGRYIEAADLARRVIRDYPSSPQAGALRAQLSRLEELATNPDAPPARLRLD